MERKGSSSGGSGMTQSFATNQTDEEQQSQSLQQQSVPLMTANNSSSNADSLNSEIKPSEDKPRNTTTLTPIGLKVLTLLAIQNCSKNILMRFVMKEHPQFLHSTAVIVVEVLKLLFSAAYIQYNISTGAKKNALTSSPSSSSLGGLSSRRGAGGVFGFGGGHNAITSIYTFLKNDKKHTLLLIVPATSYSLQMSLEYVAFAHMDAATFSVLVQMKMLATAVFFWIILGRKLVKRQVLSLVLLTAGVMLCNMKIDNHSADGDQSDQKKDNDLTGICATMGIALSSAFASVYTEKVIKSARNKKAISTGDAVNTDQSPQIEEFSLPHMQCQLAIVSLVILGFYTVVMDMDAIIEHGFFYKFNFPAFLSCLNSAIGGLIVAAALKYADSVLKGYATAISVVLTGSLSSFIFETPLTMFYGMGMLNVVIAVLLYNGGGLDDYFC